MPPLKCTERRRTRARFSQSAETSSTTLTVLPLTPTNLWSCHISGLSPARGKHIHCCLLAWQHYAISVLTLLHYIAAAMLIWLFTTHCLATQSDVIYRIIILPACMNGLSSRLCLSLQWKSLKCITYTTCSLHSNGTADITAPQTVKLHNQVSVRFTTVCVILHATTTDPSWDEQSMILWLQWWREGMGQECLKLEEGQRK